ncbi:hypothetical protein [Acidicapsa acidisoli]|uniref:hypothetical protein n=1 Tax=Acidicapsa acidisoli TaxID=1615681 RepID=UPI0021E0579C|nr:hypothetical protein [Acidicapsa acidisoli]
MILGLAGRRIDARETSDPVFPFGNAGKVGERLERLLSEQGVRVLVCSAACGADLIALQVAETLDIRSRIILPFEPGQFRQTSVIDRPGDWGPIFDRIIAAAEHRKDLIDLQLSQGDEAYVRANHAILDEIVRVAEASGDQAAVSLVWDQRSKGKDDYTEYLGEAARELGLTVFEVSTL